MDAGGLGEEGAEAFDVREFDGSGVGRGEVGIGEELEAGESCDGGVVGFGEGAESLDAHVGVGLGEELGLLEEEICAELAVGLVLLGEVEVLAFFFGEVGEGEGVGILNDKF